MKLSLQAGQQLRAAPLPPLEPCTGLNSIIKGVTNCLWHDYNVRKIYGATGGYNGLSAPDK